MKTFLPSLLLSVTLLAPTAWADPEVHLLWSPESARVLESHAAVVATPVELPANAVWWKWDRVEAQQAIKKVYPQDRTVITAIKVERSAGSEVSEVDLRESLSRSREKQNPQR